MERYHRPDYYRWDEAAQASYLSIDSAGSSADKFVSYDDEATIRRKFDYARSKGIGGLIVWELGGGYRPELAAGSRDGLLQAVKSALYSTPGTEKDLPSEFSLAQNYPNPFNPVTRIEFHIPIHAHVTLKLYDMLGREVARLINRHMRPGRYVETWDARSPVALSILATGTYIYRLEARPETGEAYMLNRKLILVK